MPEFADRLDAAVTAWKAKLKREQRSGEVGSAGHGGDVVAELQRAAQQLEMDLAQLLDTATLETRRAVDFEARAMEAVRDGDDGAAREALRAQQECVGTLATLDAEATVVRAMIAECRAVLGQNGESKARPLPLNSRDDG